MRNGIAEVALAGLSLLAVGLPVRAEPGRPVEPAARQSSWSVAESGKRIGRGEIADSPIGIEERDGVRDFQVRNVVQKAGRAFLSPLAGPATMTGVTVENVDATCSRRCIYVRGDSGDWAIRRFRLVGSSDDTPYGAGIAIKDTAHDILIENGAISHWRAKTPAGYPNADGIAAERGVRRLTIRNVTVRDVTDGAFDLKSSETVLDNVTGRNARYTLRAWAEIRAGTITSIDPEGAHIQASSATTDLVVDRLIAVGAAPLVKSLNPAARVVIKSCDLSRWTGTRRQVGAGDIRFGQGC